MKLVWGALVTVVAFISSEASAATRYDVTSMICTEVHTLIEREGAVVLAYRSSSILGLPVYDRYVTGREYCAADEVIRRTGIPAADKKYCPVKKCVESQIFISR